LFRWPHPAEQEDWSRRGDVFSAFSTRGRFNRRSSAQVRGGVELVQETGKALIVINDHVSTIHQLVSNIEAAAADQYRGLNEVNQAVHEVELLTQHNAAMVEENTAEIHGLRHPVDMLNEKIERLQDGHEPFGTQLRRLSRHT
jgi:methyl-accepting chemotaxis protein